MIKIGSSMTCFNCGKIRLPNETITVLSFSYCTCEEKKEEKKEEKNRRKIKFKSFNKQDNFKKRREKW